MNLLWERFVFVSLKKHLSNMTVRCQYKKYFWKPNGGYPRSTTLGVYKIKITKKIDIFIIKHPLTPLTKMGKTKWHPPLTKMGQGVLSDIFPLKS
jgi:hypothetical protein